MVRQHESTPRQNNGRQDHSTDSPLVIDLPDGQKLFVGKIESGTVIEVATWRGTGRPDSRTNRIIVGMSSGEIQAVSNQSDEVASPELSVWQKVLRRLYTPKEKVQSVDPSVESNEAKPKNPRSRFQLPRIKGLSTKKVPAEPEIDPEVADFLANIRNRASNRDKIQQLPKQSRTTEGKKSVQKRKPQVSSKKKATGKKR